MQFKLECWGSDFAALIEGLGPSGYSDGGPGVAV